MTSKCLAAGGARAGVAVYLVSAGYLSGVTMLFHQAKPLANVVLIATIRDLWIAVELNLTNTLEPRHWETLLPWRADPR